MSRVTVIRTFSSRRTQIHLVGLWLWVLGLLAKAIITKVMIDSTHNFLWFGYPCSRVKFLGSFNMNGNLGSGILSWLPQILKVCFGKKQSMLKPKCFTLSVSAMSICSKKLMCPEMETRHRCELIISWRRDRFNAVRAQSTFRSPYLSFVYETMMYSCWNSLGYLN